LGVLCVADREPRGWTDAEVETVQEVARAAAEVVELAATNAKALLILESIGDAFLALDENEEFVYLNAAAERLLARSRDELLGRNAWSEFPDLVGTPFEIETRRAISLGEPVEFEACYEPADIWFSARLDPAGGRVPPS